MHISGGCTLVFTEPTSRVPPCSLPSREHRKAVRFVPNGSFRRKTTSGVMLGYERCCGAQQ